MLRSVLMTALSLIIGYGILVLLIDGIFQDSFPRAVIQFLQSMGMDYTRANEIYGIIFMDNKDLFVALGFILLFLVFFYLAMSKITRYLDDIGEEIGNIMSDSDAPVTLVPELRPISEKLNTLKMTLKRREYEAMESEQRKNDLVVFLAHDLKTPLTSIIAYLTMLDEQPDMPAEEREKYTHISLEKSLRLGELISEFFEITRFNLQDIVLEKENIDIGMMLEQLADESYAVLANKSLTCTVNTKDNLVVNGDPDKLARVFDNLLRNAIAYSYEGTAILIQAEEDGGLVTVTFTDRGDPIPEHKLGSIFEKFYRLDSARSSQTGGAGLGLAIAQEIVTAHRGEITAESDAERTVFTVHLPVR